MPGYAVKYWQNTLAKMVKTPTWQEMKTRYRWGDTFLVEGWGIFGFATSNRNRGCD